MEEKTTKPKLLAKLSLANVLVIALGLGTILAKRSFLPEKVPLFYSRPWGEEQLAGKDWLFVIPLASLAILVFSNRVEKLLQKKGETFLPDVLNSSALLFSVLGTVTILKIVFLIT